MAPIVNQVDRNDLAYSPRTLAFEAAQALMTFGRRYPTALLRMFQKQVGLPPTGVYDGRTRGALIAMGVLDEQLPLPFMRDQRTIPYFVFPEELS